MGSAKSLSNFTGILYGPIDLPLLRERIIASISFGSVGARKNELLTLFFQVI